MPLFGKKYPSRDQIDTEGTWSMSQGTHEGKPIIARVDTGYREIAGHPEYAHQVGIAVRLASPDETGLPASEEFDPLTVIEDALCESLETENESLLVCVLTTGGMREFVFYTTAPEKVTEKFILLEARITSHEIQLMIQPDKSWSVYKQFI